MLILSTMVVGCKKKEVAKDADGVVEKKEEFKPIYGAEYVSLSGEVPFNTVTFKDVGISSLDGSTRSKFFQEVAMQLAQGLQQEGESLKIQHVSADTDPKFADPSFHLACGTHHIYVDLWRNDHETGYSLWSGCSSEDNFAWVTYPNPPEHAPEVLAKHLTDTLVRAIKNDCFILECTPKEWRPPSAHNL